MLHVGLIGCGRIAEHVHLEALSRVPGLRVSAVVDADPERLDAVARRVPEAVPMDSAEALLDDPAVGAVVIATPPATHVDLAVQAFQAGKHVYLEKPVAPDLDGAQRVVDAWRTAGTVGAVGFNYRFHPLVGAARARIADLGPLTAIRTVFTTARRTLPPWKRARATGGGILLDLASHHADLVPFLTGEDVTEVWADVRDSEEGEGTTAVVQARLASGVPVQMLFSSQATDEDRVEVLGEQGRVHYDRLRSGRAAVETPSFAYGRGAQVHRVAQALRDGLRKTLASPGDPSFQRAFAAFAGTCAGGDRDALATPDDGLRSLAVVVAAEASALSGRAVTL
jgi:myo-inositol 2-dehydrogenase / D-chiro-inositol 1-dehydrogenase